MVIVVNKPYGVLSQFNKNPDYPDQKTLQDIGLPLEFQPVGRLDLDSEGLLLLSDEKEFENALLNPKRGHKRSYLVQVDGSPDQEAIKLLRGGDLEIRGHKTKKCRVRVLENAPKLPERVLAIDAVQAKRSSWMLMELTEGKNRQVRKMTAKVGFPTLRLVRVKIGSLELKGLAPAEWRTLSEEERELVFQK